VLTNTSGLGDIYIKDDDSYYVNMFIYLSIILYIDYVYIDHVVMGIIDTLSLLIAKHDIYINVNRSKLVSAI
jgi:hypothetical protein